MTFFAGKRVLITGASSGIGEATALRLASLGAHLGLASRNRETLQKLASQVETQGVRALVLPTDVTDSEQVRHSVEESVRQLGGLDILICSAGQSMRAYFENSSLEAMEHVMRVNFFGTLYATHHALPHIKQSRGSLVALSSMTGKRGTPSYSVYGASKFAVHGLYEALGLELQPQGVHVGVVSPAFVDTPLRNNVLGPGGKVWATPPKPPFRVWPVEKCVDRILKLIVKRRREITLPGFIAPVLVFDRLLGNFIGNRILRWKFPPEQA